MAPKTSWRLTSGMESVGMCDHFSWLVVMRVACATMTATTKTATTTCPVRCAHNTERLAPQFNSARRPYAQRLRTGRTTRVCLQSDLNKPTCAGFGANQRVSSALSATATNLRLICGASTSNWPLDSRSLVTPAGLLPRPPLLLVRLRMSPLAIDSVVVV